MINSLKANFKSLSSISSLCSSIIKSLSLTILPFCLINSNNLFSTNFVFISSNLLM
ncbi:hypothetical protein [Campylobacter phage CJLB-14]|nr:hypothetical protein [Campylobacter phage CJLB-14]